MSSVPREAKDIEPSDRPEVPKWASRAWEELAEPLQAEFGAPGYATWLAAAAVVGATDGEITLGVPHKLARDRIVEDYLPDIQARFTALLDRDIAVNVLVSSDLRMNSDDTHVDTEPTEHGAVRLTVEVRRREKTGQPRVLGRMENNIARKAFFDLQPSRSDDDPTEVRRDDLVGTTALQYTMGQLGALEMDVCTWALGRWKRGDKRLRFSKRELARDMGLSWGGKTGQELTDALLRLRGTSAKGEVWLAETKRHITRDLSFFQELTVDEYRESRDGPAIAPGQVELVLSDWLHGQLQRGQYASLDFETYRHDITTPFARRLYHILECEEGTDGGTHVEFRIDSVFMSTMGSHDSNVRRFRGRLAHAGEIICRARPHYTSICVEVDGKRTTTLRAARSPDWQLQRAAWRRAENFAGWRESHGKIIDVVGRVVDATASSKTASSAATPPTALVAAK